MTHDSGMDSQPSWQELKAERDALAAHVERITDDIHALIAESVGVVGLHMNGDVAEWGELLPGGRFEEWLLSIDDKPTTSLARRDAEQRALGLSEAFEDPIWGHLGGDAKNLISDKLNGLRRQAEGGE